MYPRKKPASPALFWASVLWFVLALPMLLAWNTNQSITDHRYLSNLTTQNDHTQYLMRDGSNALTGTVAGTSINLSADITATRGWIGGVQLSGGSAFFGTEHNSSTGAHTGVNAITVTAPLVQAATLNVTSSITAIPNGNGVGISGGNLVAEVADGLGFGSGNITPVYGTATPATINDETGSAGSVSELSRRDHRHPVVYGLVGDLVDISQTASAGTSSKFMRADARLKHPVMSAGDLHTQYVLADGTRAFTGDQSMGGFQLTNPRAEQIATGSEPTPAAGTKGRWWFNSSTNQWSYDDGTNRVRAVEAKGGAGLTESDASGLRTLAVGAGTGIIVNANDVQIDTSLVPRLNNTNNWIATNTFRDILPDQDVTRDIGTSSFAYRLLYCKAIMGSQGGAIELDNSFGTLVRLKIQPFNGQTLDLGDPTANGAVTRIFCAGYYGDAGTSSPAVFPAGIDVAVVATGSLPAAGAANDGRIIIEDAGVGDRNLIIYAGSQRFRIDGGAPF